MLALTTAAIISFPSTLAQLSTARAVTSAGSAYAHKVETAGDVGATMHIEPNDTPRAGDEVLAWFAIARPGGETIPSADCNCTLAVYAQPRDQPRDDKPPDLTPTLAAVNAEGYQDIPGARFTFPDVGTYTLVINGEPKQEGEFSPFELDFETTVASGSSSSASTPQATADTEATLPSDSVAASPAVAEPAADLSYVKWAIVGVGIIAVIAIARALFRRPQ